MASSRASTRKGGTWGREGWWTIAALALLVTGAPQLLAGAYGWGITAITAVSGLASLAAARWLYVSRRRVSYGPVVWAAAGGLAWTVFQTLPLPRELVILFHADAVELADHTHRLGGLAGASWLPLSIAPVETQTEVVKGAAIFATLVTAWATVASDNRRRVVAVVATSTVVMAVVALAHLGVGSDRVFGVYEPVYAVTSLLAPLLNQNHLSGFVGLGVPLLIGLALEQRDDDNQGARWVLLGAAVICGGTALISASRGGVASLGCGVLVLGLLGLRRARSKSTRRPLSSPLAIIAATAATASGVGLYVASESLFHDFEHGDISKLELIVEGFGLAIEKPWTGVGRGAFPVAFAWAHGSGTRANNPENFIAQWASEWGVVVATALLAVMVSHSLRAVRRARSWQQLGAIAALLALAVHELVDFSTEMLGVAVVAAALVSAALARRSPRRESGAPAWIVPTAAGLLALTAVAWWGWRIDARGIHGLQQALVSRLRAGDRQGFASTLNTAVQLHPTEPSFALLAGAEASHRGDPPPLPWLTHAMRLAEGWDAPHIEAARYLAGRQQFSQAFLEAREAEMRRPESSTILVAQILDENPETLPELVRIAGTGVEGSSWLDRVATRLPFASRALPPLDHELVERGIVGARVRRARRLARVDAAAALEALEPIPEGTNAEVDLARARVLIDSGNADQAASLITDHLVRRARDPVAALRLRAEAHAVAGNAEAMRATMDMVRGRASGHAAQLSHAWIFQGHQERVLGHEGAAVRAFERAHRLAPSEASLVQVAVQAERVGDHGRAMRAYSELCRLAGNHGPHCDAEGRAREKMSERSPPPVQPHGAP